MSDPFHSPPYSSRPLAPAPTSEDSSAHPEFEEEDGDEEGDDGLTREEREILYGLHRRLLDPSTFARTPLSHISETSERALSSPSLSDRYSDYHPSHPPSFLSSSERGLSPSGPEALLYASRYDDFPSSKSGSSSDAGSSIYTPLAPSTGSRSDVASLIQGNDEPLRKGHLWFLNVYAPPPYKWVRTNATLYPTQLLLTWVSTSSGRGVVALDLMNCTELRSIQGPTHPNAWKDLGSVAARRQSDGSSVTSSMTLSGEPLSEVLCPFQLIYGDGVERLAATSDRKRTRWLNTIWGAVSRAVSIHGGSTEGSVTPRSMPPTPVTAPHRSMHASRHSRSNVASSKDLYSDVSSATEDEDDSDEDDFATATGRGTDQWRDASGSRSRRSPSESSYRSMSSLSSAVTTTASERTARPSPVEVRSRRSRSFATASEGGETVRAPRTPVLSPIQTPAFPMPVPIVPVQHDDDYDPRTPKMSPMKTPNISPIKTPNISPMKTPMVPEFSVTGRSPIGTPMRTAQSYFPSVPSSPLRTPDVAAFERSRSLAPSPLQSPKGALTPADVSPQGAFSPAHISPLPSPGIQEVIIPEITIESAHTSTATTPARTPASGRTPISPSMMPLPPSHPGTPSSVGSPLMYRPRSPASWTPLAAAAMTLSPTYSRKEGSRPASRSATPAPSNGRRTPIHTSRSAPPLSPLSADSFHSTRSRELSPDMEEVEEPDKTPIASPKELLRSPRSTSSVSEDAPFHPAESPRSPYFQSVTSPRSNTQSGRSLPSHVIASYQSPSVVSMEPSERPSRGALALSAGSARSQGPASPTLSTLSSFFSQGTSRQTATAPAPSVMSSVTPSTVPQSLQSESIRRGRTPLPEPTSSEPTRSERDPSERSSTERAASVRSPSKRSASERSASERVMSPGFDEEEERSITPTPLKSRRAASSSSRSTMSSVAGWQSAQSAYNADDRTTSRPRSAMSTGRSRTASVAASALSHSSSISTRTQTVEEFRHTRTVSSPLPPISEPLISPISRAMSPSVVESAPPQEVADISYESSTMPPSSPLQTPASSYGRTLSYTASQAQSPYSKYTPSIAPSSRTRSYAPSSRTRSNAPWFEICFSSSLSSVALPSPWTQSESVADFGTALSPMSDGSVSMWEDSSVTPDAPREESPRSVSPTTVSMPPTPIQDAPLATPLSASLSVPPTSAKFLRSPSQSSFSSLQSRYYSVASTLSTIVSESGDAETEQVPMLVDGPGDEETVSAVVPTQRREPSRKIQSPPAYDLAANRGGGSRTVDRTARVGNGGKRAKRT